MPDFDFGFNGNTTSNDDTVVDKPADTEVVDVNTGEKVDENGNPIVDVNEKDDTINKDKDTKEDKQDIDNSELIEEGTIVEFGNDKYTADKDGNLVDKDGNIFKEAKDVKSWLESLDTEESNESSDAVIDVKAVQKALGVDITDEDGNVIEFENTADGVASYVKAYVEHSQRQIAEATIDMLYSKYPILENVINYYVANGNSLEGFNELPDRSNIELDVNDEQQCEAIVRAAWKEEGRKGNVDNYIQYLKSQNLLGVTAEEELSGMIERDKAAAEKLAAEAEAREQADIEAQQKYWGDINKRIMVDKRIGNYQIPDTIIRIRNGQRTSATPQDFYNYIYQVDKYGRSAYENDLIRESKENPEARITDDMIAAYLKFTGGNYESLINMAINEKQVKTIKIKSKTAPKSRVKVVPPTKSNGKSIDFGY